MGVAYFRVDISNPTEQALFVGSVYVQFEDDMKITIRKCKLKSPDIKPHGHTPIQVKPGENFSASSSCKFPISQMGLVKQVVSFVDFSFMAQQVQERPAVRKHGPQTSVNPATEYKVKL